MVGFIHVPVRLRKDGSNRCVSLTYQLRRRNDVLVWSETSQPICDLNETSLRRRMPGGKLFMEIIILVASLVPGRVVQMDTLQSLKFKRRYVKWRTSKDRINLLNYLHLKLKS